MDGSTLKNHPDSHHEDTKLSTIHATYYQNSPMHPGPHASCHRVNTPDFCDLIRPYQNPSLRSPQTPTENSSKELGHYEQRRKHSRFFGPLSMTCLWVCVSGSVLVLIEPRVLPHDITVLGKCIRGLHLAECNKLHVKIPKEGVHAASVPINRAVRIVLRDSVRIRD